MSWWVDTGTNHCFSWWKHINYIVIYVYGHNVPLVVRQTRVNVGLLTSSKYSVRGAGTNCCWRSSKITSGWEEWGERGGPVRITVLCSWMTDRQQRNAGPWLAHWGTLNIFTHPLVCPLSPRNPSHFQVGENATSIVWKITRDRRWESSSQNWQHVFFVSIGLWVQLCVCVSVVIWILLQLC